MDSDGDFYPDGFEVLNVLDPFTAEGSSIEFIPLGFEVGVGDTVRMWAMTRDRTGHLRSGGDVTFQMYYDTSSGDTAFWSSNINFAYFYPAQHVSSDSRGLITSLAHTYYSLNYNKVCYNGSGHPAYCRRHKAKATGSQGDVSALYFQASYAGEDPLSIKSGDGQTGLPLLAAGVLIVRTEAICSPPYDCPIPAVPITFSVLGTDTITPGGFDNAKISTRWTFSTRPFEYPVSHPFRDDDPKYLLDNLTVFTDLDGYASVQAYFGNTSHMTYRIKAKMEMLEGESVIFTLSTIGSGVYDGLPSCFTDGRNVVGGVHVEAAEIGAQVPLSKTAMVYHKRYCVDDENSYKCSYRVSPGVPGQVGWAIHYYPDDPEGEQIYANTDANGVARTSISMPTTGTVGVDYWMLGWDDLTISGVSESLIRIVGMKRKTISGDYAYLSDQGNFSPQDLELLVTISNPTSYFLKLELKEYPDQGSDLLLPRNYSFEEDQENEIVVFPGLNIYEFALAHQGETGEAKFRLYDMKGDEIDSATVYMQCCDAEKSFSKYDTAYQAFMTLEPFRFFPIWLNWEQSLAQDWRTKIFTMPPLGIFLPTNISCADWANWLKSFFNKFVNCMDCCEVKHAVNTAGGFEPDRYAEFVNQYIGSHDWVQVGCMDDCNGGMGQEWRSYDAWFGYPFLPRFSPF